MGQFAKSAAQHDLTRRVDGTCVAGKWISSNLDDEDMAEFIRLASAHKWRLILSLSANSLRYASLNRHVHGECTCSLEIPGRACCTSCDKTAQEAS